MKNNILKGLLSLILITMTLPAQSQDFINIFFKNGDTRKFYLNEIIEFKASKKDADGVQHNDYEYQYIKTLSDEYFYRIEDVESISFAKRNEVLEEQNFVNAMTSVFPIINECSGINDVESHLDAIKTAEGVEHAWTDDHQLYIEIEEGEILSFHFDHNELVDESSIENIDSEAKALASKISRLIKPDGSRLKFAIANQQDKDESRNGQKLSYFLPLVSALKGCGIDVDYISSPSVEFFYDNSDNPSDHLNFYDYDAVILSTHGSYSEYINYDFWFGDSYGPKVHSISLSDDLFKEEYESDDIVPNWHDNFKTFKKWRKKLNLKDVTDQHISYSFNKETRGGKKYWVAHPNLSELFFRDIAPGDFKNPNSIFFNCACQSLKENNSFAEELINNHGLGVYAGYTESNYFGQLSSHTLFSKMFSTLSLEKAYQELPSYMRHETFFNINISSDFDIDDKVYYQKNGVAGAELKILPENDSSVEELFILPVYTNFTSQENIIEEYNKSQTVKLSGTLTCLTAVKDVELGFLYGSGSIPTQKIEATSITNIFNLGKGNYTFTAELSNLEPGNTYFYRAYSFDGMNYNYGEPCSFEIPAQSADEKQVMLTQNVGGTTYEIYKINTDKNDYHINPDGWKCYKSSLMLDMTKNGKTSTYTLDDNIYLDSSESHHGGQRPCLYLSSSSDQLFIFINSKDSRNNYTMDGYAYRTSLSNVSFTRETVFTGRNWGWSPYFTYSDGVLSVQHFSYAGYYAMTSYRNSDGTWTTKQGSSIKPDAFNEQSEQAGNVLIDDNPGLALSQTQLSIIKGGSATVEITAGSGEYGVTNLNSSIARGTLQGTTVTIDGVDVGNDAKIVVTDMQTGQQIIITVFVTASSGTETPGEAIDLGLPSGTLWASCNVGATKPEEYGGHYAWGETEEKNTYDSRTYMYSEKNDIGSNISGTQYDVAHVKWGGDWRMPTLDEFKELIDNTTSEWTMQSYVYGCKFTSKTNGNSIFLPAAGIRHYGNWADYLGNYPKGFYWSSSLLESLPKYALSLRFNTDSEMHLVLNGEWRAQGMSVRPVR